jgi:hypothetical protein
VKGWKVNGQGVNYRRRERERRKESWRKRENKRGHKNEKEDKINKIYRFSISTSLSLRSHLLLNLSII